MTLALIVALAATLQLVAAMIALLEVLTRCELALLERGVRSKPPYVGALA